MIQENAKPATPVHGIVTMTPTPYYVDNAVTIYHGDCLVALQSLADNSVDSIVTDPPYGLAFMGKKWDYDVPSVECWAECLRVLKPGGHLLAFAGTRTQHRMACRIEDAGFEIRDMITYLYSTNETARQLVESLNPEQLKLLDATFGRDGMLGWGFGSGFPKSLDVGKAIDKVSGAEREVVGVAEYSTPDIRGGSFDQPHVSDRDRLPVNITAPATEAAKQWDGWGSALKPSLEPITMARKPLNGTIAGNVLKHGVGGINVDGCRIGVGEQIPGGGGLKGGAETRHEGWQRESHSTGSATEPHTQGRFPANLITDGSDEVVGLFPENIKGVTGAKAIGKVQFMDKQNQTGGSIGSGNGTTDFGSAARFFYCAKADATERRSSKHPTVKPLALMRYLVRLVTPIGATVLDPFMGSGTTIEAARLESCKSIGMEREAEYCANAVARLAQGVLF